MLPPFLLILSHLSWNMESKLFQPGWLWANDETRPYPSGIPHVIQIMVILLRKFHSKLASRIWVGELLSSLLRWLMIHWDKPFFACPRVVRKWGCNQTPPCIFPMTVVTNDSWFDSVLTSWVCTASEDIVENILHEAPGWPGLVTQKCFSWQSIND